MTNIAYRTHSGTKFQFDGWPPGESPVECWDAQKWVPCLHGCMLALYLLDDADLTMREIADDGVLHELVHLAQGVDICTHGSMDALRERVVAIQGDMDERLRGMARPDFADAYAGAREDLSIWKRRALEAERDLRAERITSARLSAALGEQVNGQVFMGEPAVAQKAEPSNEELQALSRECERMPGGAGMFYANYARALLSRYGAQPAASAEPWRPSDAEAMAWAERHLVENTLKSDAARCAIDDARSLHMLAAPVAAQAPQDERKPFAVLAVFKNGEMRVHADAAALSSHAIDENDRAWAAGIGAKLVEVFDDAQAPAAAGDGLTPAARDVLAERQRQISVEGWTTARDDAYDDGQLAEAAAVYALHSTNYAGGLPKDWPWARKWWKPGPTRRMLEKAGALILAEIERLDRAAMSAGREG